MKVALIIFLSCLFTVSVVCASQDITLPKIEAKIGMDVLLWLVFISYRW